MNQVYPPLAIQTLSFIIPARCFKFNELNNDYCIISIGFLVLDAEKTSSSFPMDNNYWIFNILQNCKERFSFNIVTISMSLNYPF